MPSSVVKIMATACLAALALSGCERKAATPVKPAAPARVATPVAPAPLVLPQGFQHDDTFDAQGYYLPVTPITVGNLPLRYIAMGAPSDFRQWEAGDRQSAFGPILLHFEDQSSPASTNEVGEQVHAVVIRVLPAAYRVTPGAVSFSAADPKVGQIGFVGTIDPTVLATAQGAGVADNRVALTGRLKIGDAVFDRARFSFFMGD